MANTTALQQAIEWVRRDLGERHKTVFTKSPIHLRTGGIHTFNAVAKDGSLVATVTNHSGVTSGGKKPVGKIESAIADLYWPSLVDAPQRSLVVTNHDFFTILEVELEGALVERLSLVTLRCLQTSPPMSPWSAGRRAMRCTELDPLGGIRRLGLCRAIVGLSGM